jgi:hypothetical protein
MGIPRWGWRTKRPRKESLINNLVLTPNERHYYIKINLLMPFKEIFVVYSEIHMKLINIQWRVTCKYTEENYISCTEVHRVGTSY